MRNRVAADSVRRRDSKSGATGSRNRSSKLFLVFGGNTRASFLRQEIFFVVIKIKFIFFLSLSQLISSLKPAGEDDQKACVNKL